MAKRKEGRSHDPSPMSGNHDTPADLTPSQQALPAPGFGFTSKRDEAAYLVIT